MGSSIPHLHAYWVLIAIVCGVLYLVFDATRSFALQLSPVRLRRILSDVDGNGSSLRRFDLPDLQLVSGALLQVSLVVGTGATALVFDNHTIGGAVARSVAIWASAVLAWKGVLILVPEDTGEGILRKLVPLCRASYFFLWPLLYPLRALAERLERNGGQEEEDEEVSDEEVRAYIDVGEEEGIIEASEGKMLQSIVDFGDRLAHEIMTPRIDLVAFDAKRPIAELAKLFSDSKYARIPIYEKSIDRITGIVHIKDVFDAILRGGERAAGELARAPYFVPESKRVSELLREFQTEHLQIAVVVDEYGGTAGIITTEDVIEEIVGDIADEHEDEEATVVEVGDGTWMVSGLLRVEDFEEKTGARLASDDYETVAGMIFTSLGRVPLVGAVVARGGYLFEVERADRRRIYRVRVRRDPDWKEEHS